MSVAYLQHILSGRCSNQAVVNILWFYVSVVDVTPTELATLLATAWEGAFAPNFISGLPVQYVLEQTETQVFDVTWQPQLSTAHIHPVGLAGDIGGSLMGQSPYAVLNFHLDYSYSDVPPGHGPVKRSYIAYGPLTETLVNDAHVFTPSVWPAGTADNIINSVTNSVTILPNSADAVPIRVGSPTLANGGGPDPNGYRSWAKVIGGSFRNISSDRASRIPTF